MGPAVVPNEPSVVSKPQLQTKVGQPITVMDDWEQFHTNAALLKPAKHYHSLIRALQGNEKVA